MPRRRFAAELTVRRGNDLISVHSTSLAERILFGGAAVADDSGISSLAKVTLDSCERLTGKSYKGIGSCLRDVGALLGDDYDRAPVLRQLRCLHEAFCFVRHLTTLGQAAWERRIHDAFARVKPDFLAPAGKGKGKGYGGSALVLAE